MYKKTINTKALFLFNYNLFSLEIEQDKENTFIKMFTNHPIINTKDLPWTLQILKKRLPSILFSRCYNDENIPFFEEVKKTEIGHLFEHILLEYLFEVKNLKRAENKIHSGITEWNWRQEKKGTFNIQINIGKKEKAFLFNALRKSCKLLNEIIHPDNFITSLRQTN